MTDVDMTQVTSDLPPDMNGYHYVRLLRSAPTHDTFLAHRDAAEDGEASDYVVIRVYALEYLHRDEALRHQLEREVLLARTLKPHASLAQGYPPFASQHDLFTVQAYYEQGALCEVLQRRQTSDDDATWRRCVLRELVQALNYLHEDCHLAHRHLTLENIFIDRDGHVKLAGLGRSAVLPASSKTAVECTTSPLTTCGDMAGLRLDCGAVQYMAPELFVDGALYDAALVDVWAAGVIFFVLLTRVFPFDTPTDAATEATLRERIVEGERWLSRHAAFVQLADPQAQDLLRNMLRVNPAARFTAAEVLQHPYVVNCE